MTRDGTFKGSGNTGNGWSDYPHTGSIVGNLASPPPPVKKLPASPRLRLETCQDCRRELKKIFIAMRNGEIAATTGTRLAYILDLTSRMIERTELERRIEALEKG